MRVYLASVAGLTCLVAGAGVILGRLMGAFGLYFYGSALLGLLAAIFLAFLFLRVPQRQIGHFLTMTGSLIQGTLVTVAGNFRQGGMMGKLGRNLNRMTERMIEFLRAIRENTLVLEQTGTQVAAVADQVSHASQNQAALVEEMMVGIEKLAREATNSAQGAEEAAQAARQSDLAARQGEEAVEALIRGIHSVSGRIDGLKDMLSRVEQIVETVSGIAGETNLLALNAAVEAARAGVLGRGFAVVAEEVRQLAEGASQATSRIRETVGGIETAIGRTAETVLGSVQAAEDVGQAFAGIRRLSGENARTAGQLAGACHQQASATGLMVDGVEKITEITQEATATAEETAANIQELTALSERFQKILDIFDYGKAGGEKA